MYIGVDFGTSFSQAAIMEFGQPVMLQEKGEYGTPSVFYYDQNTDIAVGQDAIDCGQGNLSVNMKTDVKMALKDNQPFIADGREFSCSQIVSEIYKCVLNKAKRIAANSGLDNTINGMVITVPAKFGYLERDIIFKSAANALGDAKLPITGVLKEPVAAALHYFKTNVEDGKNILVFDLGGGTCDIALVRANSASKEFYNVIDSEMERIGGRNWDEKVAEYLSAEYEKMTGIRVSEKPAYVRKVLDAARRGKHRLTDQEKAFCRIEIDGEVNQIVLTLDKFNELTAPLLDQAVSALKRVYNRHVSDCEIDEIICVGGSSNMKQVAEKIKEEFPLCNTHVYFPEYAVVYGAALYADIRKDNVIEAANVIDKANFSYGIQIVEDKGTPQEKYQIQNMVIQDTALPASAVRNYRPSEDNQSFIAFRTYETDTKNQRCNMDEFPMTKIGELRIELPPNTPKTTDIRTQLTLNENGVLEVRAWDLDGNLIHTEFNVNQ